MRGARERAYLVTCQNNLRQIGLAISYYNSDKIVLTMTGARLIDIDTAIEQCPIMIVLVDHDVFKSVPLAEREDKLVYDTRGIWPDQPKNALLDEPELRKAG